MPRCGVTTHRVADRVPDDDELWNLLYHQGIRLCHLSARLHMRSGTLSSTLRMRGWRTRPEPTAPCRECGKVRGFDDLDDTRLCCECRGAGKAHDPMRHIAPPKRKPRPRRSRRVCYVDAATHAMVVREREASLRRQAKRRARGEEHTGCRHWFGVRKIRPAA